MMKKNRNSLMYIRKLLFIRPADNVLDALAYLAGAVQAALEIRSKENPDQEADPGMVILDDALKQWRNSGFSVKEADFLKDIIIDFYEYFKNIF
jgi:hypothetical protein